MIVNYNLFCSVFLDRRNDNSYCKVTHTSEADRIQTRITTSDLTISTFLSVELELVEVLRLFNYTSFFYFRKLINFIIFIIFAYIKQKKKLLLIKI